MQERYMKAAKGHYEALMAALAALGMDLMEFKEKMDEGEEPEMENGGEEDSGEMESEDNGMPMKKPMDKAKVAVIVARMKNRMKG